MTVGECKRNSLALIDELAGETAPYTDDADISAKLPYFITLGCRLLAAVQGIVKRAVVTADASGEAALPGDFYRLVKAENPAAQFTPDRRMELAPQQSCVIYYDAMPADVTVSTPDSQALELSAEACAALPFFVAAQILMADGDGSWVNFQSRFDAMVTLLSDGLRRRGAHVEKGRRC